MYSKAEVAQLIAVLEASDKLQGFLAGLVIEAHSSGMAVSEFHAGLLQDLSSLSDALRRDLRRDGVKVRDGIKLQGPKLRIVA